MKKYSWTLTLDITTLITLTFYFIINTSDAYYNKSHWCLSKLNSKDRAGTRCIRLKQSLLKS